MTCMYRNIKTHLDSILKCSVNKSQFPHIVTSMYKNTYGIPIEDYNCEVYESGLNLSSNHPVRSIISLVVDLDKLENDYKSIPKGIMPVFDYLSYVNIIDKSIVTDGINKDDIASYAKRVYNIFNCIAASDPMYLDMNYAKRNPFVVTLRLLQVYFSYYHIKENTDNEISNTFANFLRRDFGISFEVADKIVDELESNKYNFNVTYEDIYRIMTKNNTIGFFHA